MNGRRLMITAVGIFVWGSFVASGVLEARLHDTPQPSLKQAAATAPEQAPPAAPRPPKERMSVYVLLAWVWLSIAVLLGLLRLRVREADRVFQMELDRAAEKAPPGLGH